MNEIQPILGRLIQCVLQKWQSVFMEKNNQANSQGPIQIGRVQSVDLFRGFCLIVMVLCHFIIYYGDEVAAHTWMYFFLDEGLGGWGAAAFLMMMGMSQVLSANRMKNPDNRLLLKRALLRGGYLFAVGLIMAFLAFGPGEVWSWDILTLMGAATVVLYFCRFLPSWLLISIICFLAIMSPLLRGMPFMADEWSGGFYQTFFISEYLPGMFVSPVHEPEGLWQINKIVKGFFLSGEFPLFPWLMFSILGFVLGRRIVQGRFRSDIPVALFIGALLLLFAFGGAYAGRLGPNSTVVNGFFCPISFYPDSFTMICLQAGVFLIIFCTLFYIYDVNKKGKKPVGPIAQVFRRTSNSSLSFYFMHYMLLGWPLALTYAITGRYPISDFMGAIPALMCGTGAIVAMYLLLVYWERHDSKWNLEGFLAILTSRVVKGYHRNI